MQKITFKGGNEVHARELMHWTREELLGIPEHYNMSDTFTAVIIVPTGEKHDSGWGCMKFILTDHREDRVVGAVGGWSDVVHLNGIGGYGRDWRRTIVTHMVMAVGWSIDCLPGSGCLRIFTDKKMCLKDPYVLSDFCVYTVEE